MFKFAMLVLLCFSIGCDSKSETKVDPFDGAWGRTQVLLENAPSDAERVRLIDNFIADFDGHSRLEIVKTARVKFAEAAKLEPARKAAAKKKAEAISDEKRKKLALAFETGDVRGSAALIMPELFRIGTRRSLTKSLSQPVALVDLEGNEQMLSYQTSIGVGTIRPTLRYILRRLKVVGPKCNKICLNDKLNAMFAPTLKGNLVDGWRLDPKPLAVLMTHLDLTSKDTITKLPVAKLISPFEATMTDYLATRTALRKSGDKKLVRKFETELGENPKGMLRWYGEIAASTNATKAIPNSKRAGVATGFWIRRMSDGTADVIETFLKSSLHVIEKSR